jgi:hypothetical protein
MSAPPSLAPRSRPRTRSTVKLASLISTALVPISSSLHTSVADTGWLIVSLYMTSAARVAMGVLSLAALSTTAVGPFLGGVLTGAFGWHSIFAGRPKERSVRLPACSEWLNT